ncbi:rho-associated protein kinase 1-like, partial [Mercenaria mercenaria]|uniref:rho-associated protein kinase 1-like n=1 Tax=Mercenaria mercenaria TaxID=6596 RepID=UPI00234F19DF
MPQPEMLALSHKKSPISEALVWNQATVPNPDLPAPTDMGWTVADDTLEPVLIIRDPIPQACMESEQEDEIKWCQCCADPACDLCHSDDQKQLIKKIKDEREFLKYESKRLKEENEQLTRENDSFREDLEKIQILLTDKKDEVSRLQSNVERLDLEKQSFIIIQDERDSWIKTSMQLKKDLENAKTLHNDEVSQLKSNMESEKQSFIIIQDERDSWIKTSMQLRQDLENAKTLHNDEVSQLKSNVESEKQRFMKIQDEIESWINMTKELREENDQLKEDLKCTQEQLKSNVDRLESEKQ